MKRMCAWCGKDLSGDNVSAEIVREHPSAAGSTVGTGAEQDVSEPGVMSTICRACADTMAAYRNPVLVVSRKWARMYEELVEMFKDRPEVQVVLDRRSMAGGEGERGGWDGPERRGGRNPLTLE